jgi:hypothetical protein
MNLGEDTIFSTPPGRIELQAHRGTRSFERRGWIVRPARGTERSVHSFSFFTVTSSDSIQVVWTTGFSGLTMDLAAARDTLRGQAHTFWDFGRPSQSADATLIRVSCT